MGKSIVELVTAEYAARLEARAAPLKEGGSDGTSPPMDATDAKIAAAEARTDVKFAKIEGKLDLIVSRLDTINTNATDAKSEARTTRRTIVGTGLSLGALILAIAAFGVNVFGMGSRVDDIARAEARQVYNQAAAVEAARNESETPMTAARPTPAPGTSTN